ncbi:hypothetical protein V6N11_017051 [Hibiscus sabdariffa]|uniref:Reverse transcriptase zinc-binding domain-containing protein n=1 Tax=Hibiscus sabdariffa TaxID=183260 RepID=A0ABR2TWY2_9ROSI
MVKGNDSAIGGVDSLIGGAKLENPVVSQKRSPALSFHDMVLGGSGGDRRVEAIPKLEFEPLERKDVEVATTSVGKFKVSSGDDLVQIVSEQPIKSVSELEMSLTADGGSMLQGLKQRNDQHEVVLVDSPASIGEESRPHVQGDSLRVFFDSSSRGVSQEFKDVASKEKQDQGNDLGKVVGSSILGSGSVSRGSECRLSRIKGVARQSPYPQRKKHSTLNENHNPNTVDIGEWISKTSKELTSPSAVLVAMPSVAGRDKGVIGSKAQWRQDSAFVGIPRRTLIYMEAGDWNRDVFGHICRRKSTLLARIRGIEIATEFPSNHSLLEREQQHLKNDLEVVLNQEEKLWFQRLRSQWICDGNSKTKYYHHATKLANVMLMGDSFVTPKNIWVCGAKDQSLSGVRLVMWLALRGSFLTNSERVRRHMALNSRCGFCRAGDEDVLHVLRNYSQVKAIWSFLVKPGKLSEFMSLPLLE